MTKPQNGAPSCNYLQCPLFLLITLFDPYLYQCWRINSRYPLSSRWSVLSGVAVLIPKYGLEGTLYLDTGDIKSVYDEEVSDGG